MKSILSLILALIIAFQLQAQTSKSNHTLLWAIKGNGLEKTSYLFGSMHVKDNRAFEFSDSLLLKIEECEAFATELHIDTLIKFTILEGQQLLNGKEEETSEQPSFSNGVPDFTTLFSNGLKDDKPTFLDAYLSNIARKLGKKM